MSLKKFNPHSEMRIDRVKAHHSVLKKVKQKRDNLYESDQEVFIEPQQPWEIGKVKNLMAGKPKTNLKKDYIFDTTNNGKGIKKKKETKKEKDSRAFVMLDSKKYHEIGGKPFV